MTIERSRITCAVVETAAGRDRSRAGDCDLWRCPSNSVGEDEADRFFNSQLAAGQAMLFESLSHSLVGAFVLLPGAHVGMFAIGCIAELFAGAAFLKSRAYIERCAFDG
jgi:hypothetical protein